MIKLNPAEITLLNHALMDGTIDLAYVLEQSANLKRSKILEKHKTEYWQSNGKTYDGWFW